MLNIIDYVVIINKCNAILAYLYLAKPVSPIMLFIYQKYSYNCQLGYTIGQKFIQRAMYIGSNATFIKIITRNYVPPNKT